MRAYFSFMLTIVCIALLLLFLHLPYTPSKEKEIKIIKANSLAHHHSRFFSHSLVTSAQIATTTYLAFTLITKKPPKKKDLDRVISGITFAMIESNREKDVDGYHIYLWCSPILHPSFLSGISEYAVKTHTLPPTVSSLACFSTISLKYTINSTNNDYSLNIYSVSLYNSTTRMRVGITSCAPNYDVCISFLLPKEMET